MNMRKIYRKVAKEYGVSVEEVKREMQAAITDAYTNPLNNNGILLLFCCSIRNTWGVLSISRLIQNRIN